MHLPGQLVSSFIHEASGTGLWQFAVNSFNFPKRNVFGLIDVCGWRSRMTFADDVAQSQFYFIDSIRPTSRLCRLPVAAVVKLSLKLVTTDSVASPNYSSCCGQLDGSPCGFDFDCWVRTYGNCKWRHKLFSELLLADCDCWTGVLLPTIRSVRLNLWGGGGANGIVSSKTVAQIIVANQFKVVFVELKWLVIIFVFDIKAQCKTRARQIARYAVCCGVLSLLNVNLGQWKFCMCTAKTVNAPKKKSSVV